MTSPQEPEINKLLAQIDRLGYQQKKMIEDLNTLQVQAQSVFHETGELRNSIQQLQATANAEAVTSQLPSIARASQPSPSHTSPHTAPKTSAEKTPAFSPTTTTRQSSKNWEVSLGTKWFSRLGIVALLMGAVMALGYTFPSFPAWGKVLAGVLLSGIMFGLGQKLFKDYTLFGRILQAGGLTLGYITLYSMYFIPQTQLFDTPWVGWSTLALYVSGLITLAYRMDSRAIGVISLSFGYYTACFSQSQAIGFLSGSLLAVASVLLSSTKPSWSLISRLSCVGSFITFAYWFNHSPALAESSVMYTAEQQAYLWFTLLIFQLGSCLPLGRGDAWLNGLVSFLFFGAYRAAFPELRQDGSIPALLAGLQVLGYGLMRRHYPCYLTSAHSASTLLIGLSLIAVATMEALQGDSRLVILSLEAVLIATLARQSGRPKLLKTLSFLLWTATGWIFLWASMLDPSFKSSMPFVIGSLITVCGLYLEDRVYTPTATPGFQALGKLTLLLSGASWWLSLHHGPSDYWLTVSYLATGFVAVATGLILKQKRYRWWGFAWLIWAGLRFVIFDLATLETLYKIAIFFVLGLGMLGASFLYNRLFGKSDKNNEF